MASLVRDGGGGGGDQRSGRALLPLFMLIEGGDEALVALISLSCHGKLTPENKSNDFQRVLRTSPNYLDVDSIT